MKRVVVVKLAMHDAKEKQKAMRAVSGLSGIESLELNLNDQKLTITGDIDPVDVVAILRKQWYAEIVSFGPPPEKKTESKISETIKKDVEVEKDGNDDKKKTEADYIADLVAANYCPCHPCIHPHYY